MKEKFLNNEFWVLTFGGGFQRANVYKDKNVSTEERKEFRMILRDKIEKLVHEQYHNTVSEEKHIQNIESIVNFTRDTEFGEASIAINFGVAQKLLNLYLKYLWCSGRIKNVPVHFPVDRLIQSELIKTAKKCGIPVLELKAWTQFEDAQEYKKVIDFAKRVNSIEYPEKSLAEMELEIFTRRK